MGLMSNDESCTPLRTLWAVWLSGPQPGGTFPKIGLRSRWNHQHHVPGAPGQLERYETPYPVRSDAVKPRFQLGPDSIQLELCYIAS